MRLEKLNLSNSKGKLKIAFASGCLITISLIVLVNFIASKALYRKTESVQLAKGTVNYSLADLNIVAMYQEKDSYTDENDKYESIEMIPMKDYMLNTEKSVCKVQDSKDENIEIKIINNKITVSNMTKKGTKCYLYFDKYIKSGTQTLANMNLNKDGTIGESVTGPSCNDSTKCGNEKNMNENGIYETEDDDGKSYIFRGTIDNNWVKFGQTNSNQDIWWRILRINGDGTIRLIYAGVGNSAPNNNGGNAINSQAYNALFSDNTHVGFYNQSTTPTSSYPEAHQGTNPSDIAKSLNTWFTTTTKLSTDYVKYIDENAGFCNDRRKSSVNHGSTDYANKGYGYNNRTWYAPFDRVAESDNSRYYSKTEQKPTLKCGTEIEDDDYKRDYFTWNNHADRGNKILLQPIGLITMDEVILAGGFAGESDNTGYWLYTGGDYWTMSPQNTVNAYVFTVYKNGSLHNRNVYDTAPGVRPVINLKAKTPFEPSNNNGEWGTKTNPFVVKPN